MGLYDGASGRGELASTAHVAKLLRAPVVLVIDAAAMARSVAAIVHGYRGFDPDVDVAGVVLNRVGGASHAELLREALAPLGVPVLGALAARPGARGARAPPRPRARRPSATGRARAVIAPARRGGRRAVRPRRAGARWRAPPARSRAPAWSPEPAAPPTPARVAIARGPAFSFHYEENLELLRAAGAELCPFDPLADDALPAGAGALLLAGGFPEVFGAELAANAPLRAEIAAFARSGRPGARRVRRAALPRRDAGRPADVRRARRRRARWAAGSRSATARRPRPPTTPSGRRAPPCAATSSTTRG